MSVSETRAISHPNTVHSCDLYLKLEMGEIEENQRMIKSVLGLLDK